MIVVFRLFIEFVIRCKNNMVYLNLLTCLLLVRMDEQRLPHEYTRSMRDLCHSPFSGSVPINVSSMNSMLFW